ncbi:MAG: pentapeptide repeat-containing protein [Chloroflexota bacterium]
MRRTIYIVLGFAGVLVAGWMIFARLVWGATFIDSGFEGKTFWEWMELLIIPFALAVFGFWMNYAQNKRDRDISEEERVLDREIAEKERETDREIARDRQRQNTLDRYFDKMGDFLGEGVFNVNPENNDTVFNPKLKLAKSITVVTINDLDVNRNKQLFQFLQEADLIKTHIIEFQAVDLARANLRKADLTGAYLRKANLREVDLKWGKLRKVDLRESMLSHVNFERADMEEADLRKAGLFKASLRGAKLKNANLIEAFLREADLKGTALNKAALNGAFLRKANLQQAILIRADLSGADLSEASLIGADLRQVDLSNADLRGANLSNADLRGADLQTSIFSNSTTMPDGSKWYEDWFLDREDKTQN